MFLFSILVFIFNTFFVVLILSTNFKDVEWKDPKNYVTLIFLILSLAYPLLVLIYS